MEIQTLDADGKPVDGLPPDGGWFEMKLPAAWLTDPNASLTLSWIDFYR
jgi:hypothetical protein